MPSEGTNSTPTTSSYPALSLSVRGILLAVAVTQFFIGHGLVWKRGANWDQSILYSYLTIPILVAAALAIKKRLTWIPWLLHSVEIACVKFGITAGFLLALLIIRGGPGFETPPSPNPHQAVETRPAETQSNSTVRIRGRAPDAGTLAGTIQDERGNPIAGALAYISDDVPGDSVELSLDPLVIKIGREGFSPSVSIGYVGQPIRFLSEDQRLHTTRATWPDHGWEFNVALPPNGPVPVYWRHRGLAELHCTVHGRAEPSGHILLSPHPFFDQTDPRGAFTISGLPEGTFNVQVFVPGYKPFSTQAVLKNGRVVNLSLRLTRGIN